MDKKLLLCKYLVHKGYGAYITMAGNIRIFYGQDRKEKVDNIIAQFLAKL